ncbi:hypothetical protein [Inquilinus sp. OTU3971]|uniref:hypothetical protein n=1 Tax=Inquilinus sp. OTU3971 TaxID=3043855 RepID=UPI00313C2BB0
MIELLSTITWVRDNWKLVLAGAGALLVAGAVAYHVFRVDSLDDALSASQHALQIEQGARIVAEQTIADLEAQHRQMIARQTALVHRNQLAGAEIAQLTRDITNLQLERGLNEDPDQSADALNALASRSNRLLERSTVIAGGAAPAGDAAP